MRVQYLSKKNIKEIVKSLELRKDVNKAIIDLLRNAESVKAVSESKYEVIVADNLPLLFKGPRYSGYAPTLFIVNYMYAKGVRLLPMVVVDEGAVDPLMRGADVMIPGIRRVLTPFSVGDFVAVLEPSERYAIVVGYALIDSSTIAPGVKGKGLRNLTWLNDDLWKLCMEIARSESK